MRAVVIVLVALCAFASASTLNPVDVPTPPGTPAPTAAPAPPPPPAPPAAPPAAPAPAPAPVPAGNNTLPPLIPQMPGYYNPCAAPPCPSNKPMRVAKVLGRNRCGCLDLPVCECRPVQYVNPELRPNPADIQAAVNSICGCLTEAVCPCRPRQLYEAVDVRSFSSNSACGCVGQSSCPCSSPSSSSIGSRVVMTQDACGCLQLAVCPCRKEYVQPEIKQPQTVSLCGCIAEPVCGCRQTVMVQPELKQSSCPCEFQNVDPCACRSSFSSNTIRPFYN